jgi:hypothetical protein
MLIFHGAAWGRARSAFSDQQLPWFPFPSIEQSIFAKRTDITAKVSFIPCGALYTRHSRSA